MRRIYLMIFSIFTVSLLMSTVSAVPKFNSDTIMDKIDYIEENYNFINKEIKTNLLDIENGGIIDLLRQIIEWLIGIVEQLISIVLEIFGLVDLIEHLINLISTLYEMILILIDLILSIFSPNSILY